MKIDLPGEREYRGRRYIVDVVITDARLADLIRKAITSKSGVAEAAGGGIVVRRHLVHSLTVEIQREDGSPISDQPPARRGTP